MLSLSFDGTAEHLLFSCKTGRRSIALLCYKHLLRDSPLLSEHQHFPGVLGTWRAKMLGSFADSDISNFLKLSASICMLAS